MTLRDRLRRPAQISGLLPLRRLQLRLAEIEPALEENARLERGLVEQVAAIEQQVGEVAHRWAVARAADQAASAQTQPPEAGE